MHSYFRLGVDTAETLLQFTRLVHLLLRPHNFARHACVRPSSILALLNQFLELDGIPLAIDQFRSGQTHSPGRSEIQLF